MPKKRGVKARNIRITPRGWEILRLLDAGRYECKAAGKVREVFSRWNPQFGRRRRKRKP